MSIAFESGRPAGPANNNLMPHLMYKTFQRGVADYPNNHVFRVSYRTDPDALMHLMPPGFSLANGPILNFVFRHGWGLDWIVGGQANIFGVSVAAVFEGRKDTAAGAYWPVLWEDDTMATILGRELLGVAKMHASFTKPQPIENGWRIEVSEIGRPMASLQFTNARSMTPHALEALRKSTRKAKVLGWKHMPSVEEAPDLGYALHMPSPHDVHEAWTGDAKLTLHEMDERAHPWNAPLMSCLRSLPLLECVGAVMSKGSGEHRLCDLRRVS